ncbi:MULTISPECIES: hypothetical protein [unclassified Kitasatospora]|uniref:hypothetical protein n=1 Tax=unclassified Kitasatospora TaxID=2633591 RepID=UPI003449E634
MAIRQSVGRSADTDCPCPLPGGRRCSAAKGIIVGSAGEPVACKWGTDTAAGWKPTCYSGVSYAPIGAITNKFGISLA